MKSILFYRFDKWVWGFSFKNMIAQLKFLLLSCAYMFLVPYVLISIVLSVISPDVSLSSFIYFPIVALVVVGWIFVQLVQFYKTSWHRAKLIVTIILSGLVILDAWLFLNGFLAIVLFFSFFGFFALLFVAVYPFLRLYLWLESKCCIFFNKKFKNKR